MCFTLVQMEICLLHETIERLSFYQVTNISTTSQPMTHKDFHHLKFIFMLLVTTSL